MKKGPDCNLVLSTHPYIGINTSHGGFTNNDHIERIHFNGAEVAVLPKNMDLPNRQQLYAILASVGMPDADIVIDHQSFLVSL